MIGQYLSNKNESATVAKSKKIRELNNALEVFLCSWDGGGGARWGNQVMQEMRG